MIRSLLLILIAITTFNITSGITNPNLYRKIHNKAIVLGYTKKDIYVVVDFRLPSTQKRLFIYDQNVLVYSTYVTHGSGSGGVYARSFSDSNGSHQSSIGVFRTLDTYTGHLGLSLRLEGLEATNRHAYQRAILVHGASYIGNGLTGRSWGCFAVPTSEVRYVINLIKNGCILIAYYPDQTWLKTSKFIN